MTEEVDYRYSLANERTYSGMGPHGYGTDRRRHRDPDLHHRRWCFPVAVGVGHRLRHPGGILTHHVVPALAGCAAPDGAKVNRCRPSVVADPDHRHGGAHRDRDRGVPIVNSQIERTRLAWRRTVLRAAGGGGVGSVHLAVAGLGHFALAVGVIALIGCVPAAHRLTSLRHAQIPRDVGAGRADGDRLSAGLGVCW